MSPGPAGRRSFICGQQPPAQGTACQVSSGAESHQSVRATVNRRCEGPRFHASFENYPQPDSPTPTPTQPGQEELTVFHETGPWRRKAGTVDLEGESDTWSDS